MKNSLGATCALAVALASALPAQAGPVNPDAAIQVRHGKTMDDSVFGVGCSPTLCVSFTISAVDETVAGTLSAFISVVFFEVASGINSSIFCSGPGHLSSPNVFSVDKNSGRATVLLTLDPAAPSCSANFTSPVTVNFAAQPTGVVHDVSSGSRLIESAGQTSKSTFRTEEWEVILNGSVGPFTGALSGFTTVFRATEHVRQK